MGSMELLVLLGGLRKVFPDRIVRVMLVRLVSPADTNNCLAEFLFTAHGDLHFHLIISQNHILRISNQFLIERTVSRSRWMKSKHIWKIPIRKHGFCLAGRKIRLFKKNCAFFNGFLTVCTFTHFDK